MAQVKITDTDNGDRTAEFIKANREGDVRSLAFRKAAGVDMPFALEQIAGRQKARRKLPRWWAVDGVIYPSLVSMEQCSSEQTALYKASLLAGAGRGSMADLTGGFGVDFSYMAGHFESAVYVERQERLCRIAEHNFGLLGLKGVRIVCADCVEYLDTMPPVDVIFIDPSRRDSHGGRTFAIADCTPDAVALMPRLLAKAGMVMVKLSPMLDWHKAVADFRGHVAEVHIVAVDNECRELLLIVVAATTGNPRIVCRNNDSEFSYYEQDAATPCRTVEPSNSKTAESSVYNIIRCGGYLLVPNAAVMKAGCFRRIAGTYGVAPLSDNSHLFVSPSVVEAFPGSHYRIDAVTTMNKKELRNALRGIGQANIAVRNFPLSADGLRKRLKLRDGGNTFIFATTLSDGSHVLLLCSRAVV